MKRLFIVLGVIISSFFFSSSLVRANTYDVNYSEDYKSYFDTEALKDFILSDVPEGSHFVVYKAYNSSQLKYSTISSSATAFACTYSNAVIYCRADTTTHAIYDLNYSNGVYTKTFNTSSGVNLQIRVHYFASIDRNSGSIHIIYTDLPFTKPTDHSFVFTDSVNTITCATSDTSCPYFSYSNFYNEFYYVDPPPADPTPLLTDFVTLTANKLKYICDYIITSYVFLSIFVIFILYFVVFLFRRLT